MQLNFFPTTAQGAERFEEAINNSAFHAEYNEEGFFFFEEDDVDSLEASLQVIVDLHEIGGYFESE